MSNNTPFFRALYACLEARVPVCGWADPGIGKTAMMTSSAAFYRWHCEVVVGSNRQDVDFLGLPVANETFGCTDYLAPGWAHRANKADRSVIVFDEFNLASESVHKAMQRNLQERVVGELPLGDQVSMVAICNPVSSANGARDLSAPVANRFCHLDWPFDADTWLTGLASNFQAMTYPPLRDILGNSNADSYARTVGQISGFLNAQPNLMNPPVPHDLGVCANGDSVASAQAYPTPRSWHNLIRVWAQLRPDDEAARLLVARGLVGTGAATQLFAWLAANDLYDPVAVLNGSVKVSWNSRPDKLFALLSAVVSVTLARGDASTFDRALKVLAEAATHRRPDLTVNPVSTLLAQAPQGVTVPEELVAVLGKLTLKPLAV